MNDKNTISEDSLELSKMFHEIKNPLALINSSLQFIESEHPEVHTFRFWDQTMKDFLSLRKLIDTLSDFQKSRFLNIQKINLFDFTEDLLEATEAFLLESGISLIVDSEIDDLDFYADDVKLRQALVNLLKNAAESSPADSPVLLHIYTEENQLCFSVEDHGCGISEEQLSHLFEPFHTTKSYGTGLGLPITKRIVESHNGTLSFFSTEGSGTSFDIRLPLT